MNLELLPRHRIESAARRVLGAVQFVDAVTGLPVVFPAQIDVRGADVGGVPVDVALHEHAVRLRQNRAGLVVVFSAPFFDAYTNTFDAPAPPPETAANPLRLRLAVEDAGPSYLPQEFFVDLPRALNPDAPDAVFNPQRVALFRTPNASVQDGWAVLRVRATAAGPGAATPLPGVLIRVFRAPRAVDDLPIGVGMTEWRGGVVGEALVPVTEIQRFRPGAGASVIETDQAIEIEATRHSGFTGATGTLPLVPALISGTGTGVIRPPAQPAGSSLEILQPAAPPPLRVQAGREYVVHLAMP
jgi:hypothetical protein